MGFKNKYPNRKDWRKHYRRGKAGYIDKTCRSGGSCPYCYNNRMYQQRKAKIYADMEIKEFMGLSG